MHDLINFRDFGGQQTASGKMVRTDRLYRCGEMDNLSAESVQNLMALDFQIIADLRHPDERIAAPSPWPTSWNNRLIAYEGGKGEAPHASFFGSGIDGQNAIDLRYIAFNQKLPFDPNYRPLFARAITEIAANEGRSLIHCTAGKDRTGINCALILSVLGVSRDDILRDYESSQDAPNMHKLLPSLRARASEHLGYEPDDSIMHAIIGVKSIYLESALNAIAAEYGTVEDYLEVSGVTDAMQQQLRDQLLG